MAVPKSTAHAFLAPVSAVAAIPSFFGSPFSKLSFETCLAISLAMAVLTPCFRAGSVQRYGVLALQIYFTVQAYFAPVTPKGNLAVSYTTGVLLGNLSLRYLDRLYLHVPEATFHRIDSGGAEERPDTLPPSEKFWWSAELFIMTRGVGWNWRVPGVPKPAKRTRTAFVLVSGIRWVAMYAGVWLAERICSGILEEWVQLPDIWGKSVLQALSRNNVFLSIFITLVSSLTVYTHFEMLALPVGTLCVGLGLGPWSQPDDWPATFGSLAEAYSVRRFWSHTWHQQLRRTLSVPAVYLTSLLPHSVQTSSQLYIRLFRRYFALLLAFVLSGAFHSMGQLVVLRTRRSTGDLDTPLHMWGEMPFFLAQGAAIMFEDLVCHIMGVDDRRGVSRTRSLVGYVLTATFYVWARVYLKLIPTAANFGISDERGPLFETVEMLRVGLVAIPGNFVKAVMERGS